MPCQIPTSCQTFERLSRILERRRSQCRPDTLSDFCRPIQSPAEHSLLLKCHLLHTNAKSQRTDWRRAAREFNLAVTRNWESGAAANLWLKSEVHLKQYEKQLVMQASLAEMAQTSSATSGVQANGSAGQALVPRQAAHVNLQPPGPTAAPLLSARKPGKGGPGRQKACSKRSVKKWGTVLKLGHDCALFLFLTGEPAYDTREKLKNLRYDVSKVPESESREEAEVQQRQTNVAAQKE